MINFIKNALSPHREFSGSLKQILGFYPSNIKPYQLAFRHKSVLRGTNERVAVNNERLEYLGDAILGAVIAHHLFKMFPYKDEGFLTEMRSKIVSRDNLNKLSLRLGLDKFIDKKSDNRSKSIYGDTFEALVGAVYLDKGYVGAKHFIINRILKYHLDLDKLEATEVNFKGKLIDWCQKEKKEINFEVIDETGTGRGKKYHIQVMIEEEPYGKSMEFSKKKAEQRASEKTLEMLGLTNNQ